MSPNGGNGDYAVQIDSTLQTTSWKVSSTIKIREITTAEKFENDTELSFLL